jgi:hypothetical protein
MNDKDLEITWSLFHPVAPDPVQMEKYIEEAAKYKVGSFEICGLERAGLDRYLLYEDHHPVRRQKDEAAVENAREEMNRIVRMTHDSGRKITFWHREVHLPEGMTDALPELLDDSGEIDFNSDTYWNFIRCKIGEFFRAVPGMDGLVLTLTESDYSVVHNSDTGKYPPVQTAARLIKTFAETLDRLGKSLTFRTFGSIDEDYQVLSTAADIALEEYEFEIETKITPYDWSLYLPPNRYIKKRKRGTSAAEFDVVGEFFGLGEIPCLFPERLIEHVKFAMTKGCGRLSARLDRLGRTVIGSVNEMNLYAFETAAENPECSLDEIWSGYAKERWGEASRELIPVMKSSEEMIKKSYYIDGHMFSQNPIPSWHMIMLGGIFSVFKENIPLDFTDGLWSMLSEKTTPTRREILKEKKEAVSIAEEGYRRVQSVKEKIPSGERELIINAWDKARYITQMHLNTARVLTEYFEEMEKGVRVPEKLFGLLEESARYAGKAITTFTEGLVYEFAQAVVENSKHFKEHYTAEYAAQLEWENKEAIIDYVVCGGITYEWRVKRYMHASKPLIIDGRPSRIVGNSVFPNGFLEYRMMVDPLKRNEALILFHGSGGALRLIINGIAHTFYPEEAERFNRASILIENTDESHITLRIEKAEDSYPVLGGIGIRISEEN